MWLIVVMSEEHEYPLHVRVQMSGYDSNRYAVLQADSALMFHVHASGFSALAMSMRRDTVTLTVEMHGDAVQHYQRPAAGGTGVLLCHSIAAVDLIETFYQQFSHYRLRSASSPKDSLRLVLVTRSSKTVPVNIADLQVAFTDGYGLYGEPSVDPAQVTLYGPVEALANIHELRLTPTAVSPLHTSAVLQLPLDPVWNRFGDVKTSTTHVSVSIPVSPYVERRFSLPISVLHADSTVRLHLYPDQVEVRVWVAHNDVASLSASALEVAVDYRDIHSGIPMLQPRLVRFPDRVRMRSITPQEIQYVIIK